MWSYGEHFICKIYFSCNRSSRGPKAWWLLTDFPQYFFIPCGLLQGQWASQLPLNFVWVSLGLYKKVSCLSSLIFFYGIDLVVLKHNLLSGNLNVQKTPNNGEKCSHLLHHLKYSMCFIQNGRILLQNQHITSKIRKSCGFYIIMLSTAPLPFEQLFNCMNISFLPILFLILFFRVLLRFSVIWTNLMDLK